MTGGTLCLQQKQGVLLLHAGALVEGREVKDLENTKVMERSIRIGDATRAQALEVLHAGCLGFRV